jgi:hypothetical protein
MRTLEKGCEFNFLISVFISFDIPQQNENNVCTICENMFVCFLLYFIFYE